jgi:hypothetical protein
MERRIFSKHKHKTNTGLNEHRIHGTEIKTNKEHQEGLLTKTMYTKGSLSGVF